MQKKEGAKITNSIVFTPWLISITIIFISIIAISAVTGIVYFIERNNELKLTELSELDKMDTAERYIYSSLDSAISDLFLMSSHGAIKKYFDALSYKEAGSDQDFELSADEASLQNKQTQNEALIELQQEFSEFSRIKGPYLETRLLNINGMEKIRVDLQNGEPRVVDESELQDKSDRYYYLNSLNLNSSEAYISHFDLNVNQNKIEQPFKPVIRFSGVVFDSQGEKSGVVVLNYSGKFLLDSLKTYFTARNDEFSMLNQDSYWFVSENAAKEWGFMFENGQGRTMKVSNPKFWDQINSKNSGQIINENGLYTFRKIYPLETTRAPNGDFLKAQNLNKVLLADKDHYWILVSRIPQEYIFKTSKNSLKGIVVLDSLLLMIIVFLTFIIHRTINERIRAQKESVDLNELLGIINKTLRHDILGKLTNIRASLEMSDQIQKDEDVKKAYTETLYGVDLVHQMRDLELSVRSGSELTEQRLVPILKEVAEEQGMTAIINGDAVIYADEALKSVFENLFRNAKIHSGVDFVYIEMSESKSHIKITVADRGRGIKEEVMDQIFEEGFK